MNNIDIREFLKLLEAPMQDPDGVVYCFCESCEFLGEVTRDLFYELITQVNLDESRFNYLDDPVKFGQEYYFTLGSCASCPGGDKIDDDQSVQLIVRRIQELYEFLEQGANFIYFRPTEFFHVNLN